MCILNWTELVFSRKTLIFGCRKVFFRGNHTDRANASQFGKKKIGTDSDHNSDGTTCHWETHPVCMMYVVQDVNGSTVLDTVWMYLLYILVRRSHAVQLMWLLNGTRTTTASNIVQSPVVPIVNRKFHSRLWRTMSVVVFQNYLVPCLHWVGWSANTSSWLWLSFHQ